MLHWAVIDHTSPYLPRAVARMPHHPQTIDGIAAPIMHARMHAVRGQILILLTWISRTSAVAQFILGPRVV